MQDVERYTHGRAVVRVVSSRTCSCLQMQKEAKRKRKKRQDVVQINARFGLLYRYVGSRKLLHVRVLSFKHCRKHAHEGRQARRQAHIYE